MCWIRSWHPGHRPLDNASSVVERSPLVAAEACSMLEDTFCDMELERELAEAKEKVLRSRMRSEQGCRS